MTAPKTTPVGSNLDLTSPSATDLAVFERSTAEESARENLAELKKVHGQVRRGDGKIRQARFLANVLALRFQGKNPRQTAEILGVSTRAVSSALLLVRKDHEIDALLTRIDDVLLPLAIDNAATGILEGDKDYTLELMRGRGLLRTHKSIEAHVKKTVLTLQVSLTMPDHLQGKEPPLPRAGAIVGSPVDPSMLPSLPPAQVLEGVIVKDAEVKVGVPRGTVNGPEKLL